MLKPLFSKLGPLEFGDPRKSLALPKSVTTLFELSTPDQSRLITSVYIDFNILAFAFRADTLWGLGFVSFAFTRAASLIESTFANFVFRSTATLLRLSRPLRSSSCDCKLYIWASLHATYVVSCSNRRATFVKLPSSSNRTCARCEGPALYRTYYRVSLGWR